MASVNPPFRRSRRSFDHGDAQDRLRPLEPECGTVQFSTSQSEPTLRQMAGLMRDRPDVELYVFGGVKDLEFLRYFDNLRRLHLAVWDLEDIGGFAYLGTDFERLVFSKTKKRFSLRFLEMLPGLRSLFLQGHFKDFDMVPKVSELQSLGLSGIPLDDLSMLVPLQQLTDVFVGFCKTRDLWALCDLPKLKDLRIIRITELGAVDVLRDLAGLACVELSWLRNIERLPNFSRLGRARENAEIKRLFPGIAR